MREALGRFSGQVCSVIGFPLGATSPEVKAFETQNAVEHGASEIDMVINIGALKARDLEQVARDIYGVVTTAHAGGAIVKVIIEAVLLTDEEKTIACLLLEGGRSRLRQDLDWFRQWRRNRPRCGPDAQGRWPGDGGQGRWWSAHLRGCENMIKAGATRIGASAGVKILQGAGPAGSIPPQPRGKPLSPAVVGAMAAMVTGVQTC